MMANQTQEAGSPKKGPVWARVVWSGTGKVDVAVFEKNTTQGEEKTPGSSLYNISAKRIYKDGNEYKTTHAFRAEDIPILIQLLTQAYAFISEQQAR